MYIIDTSTRMIVKYRHTVFYYVLSQRVKFVLIEFLRYFQAARNLSLRLEPSKTFNSYVRRFRFHDVPLHL